MGQNGTTWGSEICGFAVVGLEWVKKLCIWNDWSLIRPVIPQKSNEAVGPCLRSAEACVIHAGLSHVIQSQRLLQEAISKDILQIQFIRIALFTCSSFLHCILP